MKVWDLVKKLGEFNPDAVVNIVVHNKREKFTLAFGDFEGCTKENCSTVSLFVDDLNIFVNEKQQ